jgi:hypothetical protein
MKFIIQCSIFIGPVESCVVGFLKPQRHGGGIASKKIYEYTALFSLWLLF